jgi:hypothetical protein
LSRAFSVDCPAWKPEFSVALADALAFGVTLEEAAGNLVRDRAKHISQIAELASLIQSSLVADLPEAATDAITDLQALAVNASDLTDLMRAAAPLASVLRYGTARKLPEEALRALVSALAVEVNAGVRLGSRQLAREVAVARVAAMRAFDEALGLFGEEALVESWRRQLQSIVDDEPADAAVAGFALRRLADLGVLQDEALAAAFARRMAGAPAEAGACLETFLAGGAEILVQDPAILSLVDAWLTALDDETFLEALPLLRRAFAGFDATARQRLLRAIGQGPAARGAATMVEHADEPAFAAALPLLRRILGLEAAT